MTEKGWRAFLRVHPHHLEARAGLLKILRKQAESHTQELMGTAGKAADEGARSGKPGLNLLRTPDQPPRILAPTLDEALWGSWVREMEALFISGDWLHTPVDLKQPLEIHSPLAQALYRRHLPKVEAALRRFPSQMGFGFGPWDLWGWMGRAVPGYPMAAFVESLVPLPDQDPLEWPPRQARLVTPEPLNSSLPSELIPRPPFLYPLRKSPSPCVVVLEGSGSAWGPAFETLLRQEPVIGLSLPLFVLPSEDVEAVTLRTREGWEQSPRWCLLNHQGRLLFQSGNLPTARTLERAFREHGGPTRVEALRAFLAQNPDHAEARLALLEALKGIAEARTRAQLGLQAAKGADEGFQMSIAGFQFRKNPLPRANPTGFPWPDALDGVIWGEYATALDQLFLAGAWHEPHGDGFFAPGLNPTLDSPLGVRSPRVKTVIGRRIHEVEEALVQRPHDPWLWDLWLKWSEALGDRSVGALLDRLTPLPNAKPNTWPPEAVRAALFREARAKGDWTTVRVTLDPAWEELFRIRQIPNRFLMEDAWMVIGGPRLEALLRLGSLAEADAMLRAWMDSGGWSGAPDEAARLAQALGQSVLAARWQGMR